MADLGWGTQGQEASESNGQMNSESAGEARPADGASGQDLSASADQRGRHDFAAVANKVNNGDGLSLLWVAIGALTVAALAGIAFLLLAVTGSDDESDAALAAANSESVSAETLEQIRNVIGALGYERVVVSDIDGTIVLSGGVPSEGDRTNVVAAAEALVGDLPIDTTALVVEGSAAPAGPGAEVEDEQARVLRSELGRITATNPLIFESSSTELTENHSRTVAQLADVMLANPDPQIQVVGFADARGDAAVNETLSQARADSVRDALVALGVSGDRLEAVADGSQSSTGADAFANLERRVEFVVEGDESASAPSAPSDPNKFRIALVAPSGRDDHAFTQSMVDAIDVLVAEDSENFEFVIRDGTFVPAEAADEVRRFADEGYDLIIAHGVEYVGELQEIVVQHPDVTFAWGTAEETFGLPNLYAYDAAAEEGGYVMGAMAGLLTDSNVIGVVGPIEVGDAARYINGFTAGAQQNNPSVEVRVDYINSFADVGLASESANGHVGAGADIMTGSSEMVVGAIDVAQQSDVLWFGTQANQAPLAPNNVVASQVFHWEVILKPIIDDIAAGNRTGGRPLLATLGNGGLTIEYNDTVPLPDNIRSIGDDLTEAIASGEVVAPGG